MGVKVHNSRSEALPEHLTPFNESQKAAILLALEDIRKSKAFGASKRCKQFLSYLVERTLEGQTELLKERTLGVELCHRLPTYMTGEDPVVRLEAGEVRRRLMQYYTTQAQSPEVRIEIPVGSYIPEFHWDQPVAAAPTTKTTRARATFASPLFTIPVTALVMIGIFALILTHKSVHPASVVDDFWAPLFTTPQPVLVCVPSPVVYMPSRDLYRRYAEAHPLTGQTLTGMWGTPLNLDPNERLLWKDLVPYTSSVSMVNSYATEKILVVFDRMGKPSQVKTVTNLSIRDFRNSPAVLIGSFSNRWTMELAANLPFYFDGRDVTIREHLPPGRVWGPHRDANRMLTLDYAIVSRLINPSTGQALFIAAGIKGPGTEAAGEFLCRVEYLSDILRSAPPGWQKMNFQAVLQTEVTEDVAGRPEVVATRFW
jgi:hypothetical protein